MGDRRLERLETGDWKWERENGIQEVGDRRWETRDRRKETGDGRSKKIDGRRKKIDRKRERVL